MKEIYLDNSATTKVYPEVAKLMTHIMLEDYGNPSSMHTKGVDAEKYVIAATKQMAKALKVQDKEILFTSGGTESDNLALIGTARANCRAGKHIITTKIEHPAILKTVEYLAGEGIEIDYLSVDNMGRISLTELEEKLRPDTILVSIMH
ncbi:MAG: aminotransferase class V-fold PLP-dependent enzyme, partial [Lachnospiraceae bacterium]|nr:aminotransferase class V-fold PLP-dependent enzyme [Lachnospiraceae bacterium]